MTDAPSPTKRTDTLTLEERTKRLVVLGDPHGDLIAVDLVLSREPDAAVVSAGDNIGYADGTVCSYLCRLLEEREIRSVYGNHEDWSRTGTLFLGTPEGPRQLTPEATAWISALPYRIAVEAAALPRATIHIVHTLPEWAYVNADTAERLANVEDVQVTFCGHSHRPAIYELKRGARRPKVHRFDPTSKKPLEIRFDPNTRYVVDAGSLARPSSRRGMVTSRGTYAAFDFAAGLLQLHSIDKRPRIKELLEGMVAGP